MNLTAAYYIALILSISKGDAATRRQERPACTDHGLAEAKNNLSRVTAEVNRTGRPVTVLKNNKPWVVIQPVTTPSAADAVDVAIDFMDEYADVFAELAK